MQILILFNLVPIERYFKGINEVINWHKLDEEVNEYIVEQLRKAATLLFGPRTYKRHGELPVLRRSLPTRSCCSRNEG